MPREKILVTGGAGFIGSHLVDAYVKLGHRVVVIDNLSTGSRSSLHPKACFYKADIRNYRAMEKILAKERPTILSHLAAIAAVAASGTNPLETYEVNVMGTLHLLAAAPTIKKVMFASTAGAYGNYTDHAFKETDPVHPLSAYGASKLMAEQAVRFYAHEKKYAYTIFRLANVFGPRQNPHGESGIGAIFSKLMAEGKRPTIYNKKATRDYIYVADVVDAHLRALTKGDNTTVNIGTGTQTTNQQMFDLFAAEYGYRGAPIYKSARAGEIERSALNASLAKKMLGWKPKTSLTAGIRHIHRYGKK